MITEQQRRFAEKRADYTDKHIQMEILYACYRTQQAADRTRGNVNKLIWLTVIGVAVSVLASLAALVGAMA